MTSFASKKKHEHRARAIAKLRKELSKDIGVAVGIASSCGLWDLLRYCYLIVSRMPEPLSHLSNLRVLSLAEFEHWVRQDPLPTTFNEVYNALYVQDRATMSIDELQALRDDGFILGHTLDE